MPIGKTEMVRNIILKVYETISVYCRIDILITITSILFVVMNLQEKVNIEGNESAERFRK